MSDLKQFLEESHAGQHGGVALLRIQIRGEDLVETARKDGPANGDLAQLEGYLGDDPAFFLLRASPTAWYVITWMPEGKVGVSNRMVYASSQSNLKAAVGESRVANALQFTTVDEIYGAEPAAVSSATSFSEPAPVSAAASFSGSVHEPVSANTPPQVPSPKPEQSARAVFQKGPPPPVVAPKPQITSQRSGVFVKKIDPRTAMSRSELEHVDMLQQEDDARNEQLEQMRSRLRKYTEPAKPEVNPDNHHANSRGLKQTVAAASGGFHTVTLPLSPDAKSTLEDFISNVGTTVVEFQVEANKCISHVRSYASTEDFAPNPSEPRFYIMRTPGSRVFVYSCPEGSPPRLRMVYSTATAATVAQIQELGCRLTHRLSLFSPKECTLIAVAATIRNGQAQRVDTDKSVDSVVNYVPSAPARSLPSRFAANTTKTLDGFTDESGFRKAFSNVRPDAPAPAPFTKSPKPGLSPAASFTRTPSQVSSNEDVDTNPNGGASAWGVQLKSSVKGTVPRAAYAASPAPSQGIVQTQQAASVTRTTTTFRTTTTTTTTTATIPVVTSNTDRADFSRSDSVEAIKSRFTQFHLAGETGDDTPSPENSQKSSPEIVHSSLPGLRRVTNTNSNTGDNAGSGSSDQSGKWNPWRPVSTVTSLEPRSKSTAAPESALQSSVFVKNDKVDTGSITAFMSDITYPPLQSNPANE
ncbi:Twinfilin-1 [Coemansia interrupta]|uniref:Twinfilin-1 n=1 Tax=Coemansia interrupta TaxID=1126814 RepID=A0A9W8HK66_9FUNG|nr:Twinfilin-1 [Coemansia interrupta]